jgi:methionyl-tRNA formyltransferase
MKKNKKPLIQKNLENTKIVFMGTSHLSQKTLKTLIENQACVKLVITQPDKPSGRRKKIEFSPIKKYCLEKQIDLIQPSKLNDKILKKIKEINPDFVLVASYGLIIPKKFFEQIKIPFINIHPSLLPKLRGASPIQTALLKGLKKTGITVMKMDTGVDSGDIIFQKEVSIEEKEKYLDLEKKIIETIEKILPKILKDYLNRKITPQPQNHSEATFTKIINKKDGQIDWSLPAKDILNKFKALYLWPQTYTLWKTSKGVKKITLIDLEATPDNSKRHKIGQVYQDKDEIKIQTGRGSITLKKLKMEGKKETEIKNFINGYPNFIGSILN